MLPTMAATLIDTPTMCNLGSRIEVDSPPFVCIRSGSSADAESLSSQTLPEKTKRHKRMRVWNPPGGVKETPARWEAKPERCTFFLQCLIDARTDGKFNHAPTVATYVDMSRGFWSRYNVYHTPKQFKNYYQKYKSFWGNICWARGCSGIGWDDVEKMIVAEPDWWERHQERKGIQQLRGRAIHDFELLQTLFGSGHGEAIYAQSPYAPIDLNTDEGSGDSENPENPQFFDPLTTQPSQGVGSFSTSSGQKRMSDALGNRNTTTRKKKKTKSKNENTMSPMTTKVTHFFNVYMDVKERRMRVNLEQEGWRGGAPTNVGGGPPSVMLAEQPSPNGTQFQNPSQSNAITSPSNIQRCIHVLRDVLKLPVRSELYQGGTDLLAGSPDLQYVFLELNDADEQLYWLQRRVRPTAGDGGRGLTHPPGF